VQFDWTHRFFHSNNWVAIAARHLVDELLLTADPIELAIGTNFVFETGFTNLQFIGLAAVAHSVGDRMFENLLQSIQTDEARHAQIGGAVLRTLAQHDKAYAQRLVDKWFWRSWLYFSVVTGIAMDYLTPLERRTGSFKEFVDEWITSQFLRQLAEYGLERPWYWPLFEQSVEHYHHMIYASAYTHRATVWFDMVVPSPAERRWLAERYPASWPGLEPIWQRISQRWAEAGPGVEWYSIGATPVAFCNLCQLPLCAGTPTNNSAESHVRDGVPRIFCSKPCAWIFEQEPARYAGHKDVVARILAGEAPGNLMALIREYFGLQSHEWGRDVQAGDYAWLRDVGTHGGRG
jgi:toluene monooxygenase system protein A